MKSTTIVSIALLAVAGALLAGDLVDIPDTACPTTVTALDVQKVQEELSTGTWYIEALGVCTTANTVSTNQATRTRKVAVQAHVTRSEIAAYYGISTNDYDNLTVGQLRTGVIAVGVQKAIAVLSE